MSTCRYCGKPIVFEPYFEDGRLPNESTWWHPPGSRTCSTRPGNWPKDGWPTAEPTGEPPDLPQFLRARLDEDEQTAQAAGGQRWSRLGELPWVNTEPTAKWQPPGSDHHVANVPLDSDRDHITRFDPERVLAEVDAKRRILAEHPPSHIGGDLYECKTCGQWPYPCETIALLALPYNTHADYRKEWTP